MKKRVYLLIAFVLSFVLFTVKVDAAKDLTCKYDKTCRILNNFTSSTECTEPLMIIQKDNKITYYLQTLPHGSSTEAANPANKPVLADWFPADSIKVDYDKSTSYDKNTKTLSSCPQGYEKTTKLFRGEVYTFTGKDKDGWNPLISEKDTAISTDNLCQEYKIDDKKKSEVKNKKWKARCQYENGSNKLELYFNDKEVAMLSELDSVKYCMPIDAVLQKSNGNCPSFIYYNSKTDSFHIQEQTQNGKANKSLMLTEYDDNSEEIKSKIEVKSCEDLFGDEIIKDINKVMKIIRIAVPILLMVFGILDFMKATFAGQENEMKKTRDKFIKRVIAAVIVFLIPLFVNLILTLANDVWNNINPDTCINEK